LEGIAEELKGSQPKEALRLDGLARAPRHPNVID